MTTIIVKNADFSGGRIAGYTPPVAGATTMAFVGDSDDATSTRNFGSGGAITKVGQPASIDAAFRRFVDTTAFFNTPSIYTPNMTILGVYRTITPLTGFGVIASSERNNADGGRRGAGLLRSNTVETVGMNTYGTNAGATYSNGANTTADTSPAFVAGQVIPSGSATQSKIWRRTAAQQAVVGSVSAQPTTVPAADEAANPLRIGANYRGIALGSIDLAFVAIFPRALTLTEIDLMYVSVKKRMTALGITI